MKNLFALFVFAILHAFRHSDGKPSDGNQKQEVARLSRTTIRSLPSPTVQGRKIGTAWCRSVRFGGRVECGGCSKFLRINDQRKDLPAGNIITHDSQATDWTVILIKTRTVGRFSYDAAKDRFAFPQYRKIGFNERDYSFVTRRLKRDVHLAWKIWRSVHRRHSDIPVGSHAIRDALTAAAPDKKTPLLNQFAGTSHFKLKQHLAEAMTNIDASIATREHWESIHEHDFWPSRARLPKPSRPVKRRSQSERPRRRRQIQTL